MSNGVRLMGAFKKLTMHASVDTEDANVRRGPLPVHGVLLRGQRGLHPQGHEGIEPGDGGPRGHRRAGRHPIGAGGRISAGDVQLGGCRLLRGLGHPRLDTG